MARKLKVVRLAPPTKAPSTSGRAKIAAALSGLTDPPYKSRVAWATAVPQRIATAAPAARCYAAISTRVGVSPVPIAHTGS